MSRIKKEAVRIVERHEGIVNQFVGDEVLALFGIPTAHEDDPIRAVRAAMEIHELVRKTSPEVEERIGTKLRMHTGISTGLVVTHVGDIRDGSYGITGDTVNIGARLAARAETDEIIVGPETYRLIFPFFETDPLEAVTVRGKTKPLVPYRVIGESAAQTRFEAAKIQGFTDFTGREPELTVLYACLEKTLTGKGQFVTVVGEAGLGKSRLTYEFRHSLNRSAITVLQGRCQSMEDLFLPNTVQSVIRARLDRLDRHSRESLCLASVIGREFAHRILERISSSMEHLAQSLEDL